jgi:hypothetical protein
MSSTDEEPKPLPALPFDVDIPKEHLPEVLHVYDKDSSALCKNLVLSARVYHTFQEDGVRMISVEDIVTRRMGERRNWEKFLARCPVKFIRKYPVPVPTKDEGMFIPHLPPSGPLYTHAQWWLATAAQLVNSILARDNISAHAPATTHTFSSLHSHSHLVRRHLCEAKLLLNWRRITARTATCSRTRQ